MGVRRVWGARSGPALDLVQKRKPEAEAQEFAHALMAVRCRGLTARRGRLAAFGVGEARGAGAEGRRGPPLSGRIGTRTGQGFLVGRCLRPFAG